jgi:hypothetical protein
VVAFLQNVNFKFCAAYTEIKYAMLHCVFFALCSASPAIFGYFNVFLAKYDGGCTGV